MEISQIQQRTTPLGSIISLTQSVGKCLIRKYSTEFAFYLAKGINHIVFNDNSKASALDFKDMEAICEDTEYLKRYYCTKNSQEKNEVKDRLSLLKNYYATSHLLKYEYPMMVIHQKQDLFLKRHKLHEKLKQSQQSQSQSSSVTQSQEVLQQRFDEQNHLVDLGWTQIFIGKCQEENEYQHKTERLNISYDEEYSIFDSEREIKRQSFLRKLGILADKEHKFKCTTEQSDVQASVGHLIVDFDDLDSSHILQQYSKLVNKQNLEREARAGPGRPIRSVFETRKPLASSIIVPSRDNSRKKHPQKYQPVNKNRQSMFIGSREQRFQQTQIMKKSSLAELERAPDHHTSQPYQSTIHQAQPESTRTFSKFEDIDRYFLPRKESSSMADAQFLTTTFGKKRKDIMKVSEIVAGLPEQRDKQQDSKRTRLDLIRLKQTPVEFEPTQRGDDADVNGVEKGQCEKQGEERKEEKRGGFRGLKRIKSLQSFDQTPNNLAFVKKSKYR